MQGDVLFSCLGTTLKMAESKESQWKVDYDYQYQFAKTARENNVNCFVLVSAIGASSKSGIFYNKMKGKLEDDVTALNFPKLIIFNPTLLIRRNRPTAKWKSWELKIIRFFNTIGILRSQKPITTKQLATAMLNSTKVLANGNHSIKGQAILDFKVKN